MNIRRNIRWNLLETLANVTVMFVVYKVIISNLGISALGVWSLVLAATSIARVADIGLAGGLSRFIARSVAASKSSLPYIETTLIANLILYALIGAAIYWPAWILLSVAANGPQLAEARRILPFAIFSFTSLNLASTTSAALVGLQRSDIKSVVALIAMAVQVVISLTSVKVWGLVGLALGQIVQYWIMIFAGWLIAMKLDNHEPWRIPYKFSPIVFPELFGLGLRLQLLNLSIFFFEPVTKFVCSAILGSEALGMFEISYRAVTQLRTILMSPTQNLTPLFAAMENVREKVSLYRQATAFSFVAGFILVLAITVGLPILSMLLLHRINLTVLAVGMLLSIGWASNLAAAPAFLLGVADAKVGRNIYTSLVSLIVSGVVGAVTAKHFSLIGFSLSTSFALILGSFLLMRQVNFDLGLSRICPTVSDISSALSKGAMEFLQLARATKRVIRS